MEELQTGPGPGPRLADLLEERLARGQLELPVLQEVAQQALLAAADETADLSKLVGLITRDPTMAAHLLRIANSALYSGGVKLISLRQAINRLGTRRVGEIAMIISCQAPVFRVAGFEAELRASFRHGLMVALLAQEIARLQRWNVEEAFLTGLLHDLGQPILLQAVVAIRRELRAPATKAELLALVDLHHARAGAMLAESWSLSPRLIEAIRFHHQPGSASTSSEGELARVVAFADRLSESWLESAPTDQPPREADPLTGELGLYPEQVAALVGMRARIVEAVDAAGAIG